MLRLALAFSVLLALAPAGTALAQSPNAAWNTSAVEYRGENGERFTYVCAPNPGRENTGSVWGTDLYSDDSSVCVAGVHAGAVTFANGGEVVIEMAPGASSYQGSERSGVRTSDWGPYRGSFIVVNSGRVDGVDHLDADWRTTPQTHRDRNGARIRYLCPPNPGQTRLGTIWGTDLYSDDSAVCPAAVHAGAITFAQGGSVLIEIRPGADAYLGSERNGVASSQWGRYSGSFVVVRTQ